MSSYKGVFVQRTVSGQIHSVQVEDPFGNSLPLDPDDYLARGVQPPMDQLPDANEYEKHKQKSQSRKVKYQDWEHLVGKPLRVKIGSTVHEGKLLGIDKGAVFAISPDAVANPWLLEMANETLAFYPEAHGVHVEVVGA